MRLQSDTEESTHDQQQGCWNRRTLLTRYITSAWSVSTFVVRIRFALVKADSVARRKLSDNSCFDTPKSWSITSSGRDTTAENIVAKKRARNEAGGSRPVEMSLQKLAHCRSKDGLCSSRAMGWHEIQYRTINLSARSLEGR